MNSIKIKLKPIILLVALVSLLLACDLSTVAPSPVAYPPPVTAVPTTVAYPPPATGAPAGAASYSDWLKIFFTDPTVPASRNREGGPDAALAKAIDSARLSVDVAAYSFNLWSLRDALIHADQRGVVVRMVMESDNMDDPEVQDLKDAGIPILGDQQEGLMHDKFMVIDRSQVWTGSMNFTLGGTYYDNNNLICLTSPEVSQDYTHEFEEMFVDKRFGPDGKADTPFPSLTIGNTPLEIYFSPDDGPASRIVELILGAQQSVHFMAYSFTSNDIGNAIIQKAQAGLAVSGVMDVSQSTGQGNEYDPFKQANLDVRLDGNKDGLMHHKVMIIDGRYVITGSYNFTAAAENTNDENLVIIDNTDVASVFLQEFKKVYSEAQP